MIAELIKKNRSCRRFDQNAAVDVRTLEGLVDLARLSASAANRQPLKYVLCCDAEKNSEIFDCLAWAAYLKDWPGPAEGERPAAYIVMLGDTRISNSYFEWDGGIAAQSILLGAREIGLAGCMIAAFNKRKLRGILELASCFEILLVLAVGRPAEEAVVESVAADGDIRYWRDEQTIHHVPKRKLDDVIVHLYPQT